jgi:nitroreductase
LDIYDAIFMRQTIPKVRPDALSRELIERLLNAAVQAPNHHRNRPWRFIVLSGNARVRLGELGAQALARRDPTATEAALEAERKKPLRAPVIIAVGIDLVDHPKFSEIENICAGAAAVENLLLAAQAEGLGTVWRTGGAGLDPEVKSLLGLQPTQHLIALVYLGYPDGEVILPQRPDFHDRTTWLEE